jgi:hypothetical protein
MHPDTRRRQEHRGLRISVRYTLLIFKYSSLSKLQFDMLIVTIAKL